MANVKSHKESCMENISTQYDIYIYIHTQTHVHILVVLLMPQLPPELLIKPSSTFNIWSVSSSLCLSSQEYTIVSSGVILLLCLINWLLLSLERRYYKTIEFTLWWWLTGRIIMHVFSTLCIWNIKNLENFSFMWVWPYHKHPLHNSNISSLPLGCLWLYGSGKFHFLPTFYVFYWLQILLHTYAILLPKMQHCTHVRLHYARALN